MLSLNTGKTKTHLLSLQNVVLDLLKQNLEKCGSAAGVLIEGFPRTADQAQQYNDLVSTCHMTCCHMINVLRVLAIYVASYIVRH